jgi:hypothetical protein
VLEVVRIVVVFTVRTDQTSAHIALRDVTTTGESLAISALFAGLLHPAFERAVDGQADHIYVEGTLVSSTYEKEFSKGKSKITVNLKAWKARADSIRKLNRTKKEQVPEKVPLDAQPKEVPF